MVEELVIVEQERKIIVAWADDPEDWVASFEKQPGFPARQWAERMVELYNRGS